MQRVMIIGQSGSGKSTLARAIGEITGLPVVHIDQILWTRGWVERADADIASMIRDVHAPNAWVFEGGRSSTWDARMARADTLIWIDLPVTLRLVRVLRRTMRYYGITREDLTEGCAERFSADFLLWIWRTRATHRARARDQFDRAPEHVKTHHLRKRSQVARYIERLRTDAGSMP